MTVNAPPPHTVAKFLRELANQLDAHGDQAITMARLLASRGYPTSGSGGHAGAAGNGTSSTETAATTAPSRWDSIDATLTQRIRRIWSDGLDLQSTLTDVLSHASTEDKLPVGSGVCAVKVCERVCKPTLKSPHDRLRHGLCPSCWQAWLRYRAANPGVTRADFMTWRRAELRAKAVPA